MERQNDLDRDNVSSPTTDFDSEPDNDSGRGLEDYANEEAARENSDSKATSQESDEADRRASGWASEEFIKDKVTSAEEKINSAELELELAEEELNSANKSLVERKTKDSLRKKLQEELGIPEERATEVAENFFAGLSVQRRQHRHYSGIVPPPDQLMQYPIEYQDRIFRIAEAGTVDESARRDRLVDAEIREVSAGRKNTFFMYISTIVLALLVVLLAPSLGYTPWVASLFLSVPVFSVVKDMINRGQQTNNDDNSSKEEEE